MKGSPINDKNGTKAANAGVALETVFKIIRTKGIKIIDTTVENLGSLPSSISSTLAWDFGTGT